MAHKHGSSIAYIMLCINFWMDGKAMKVGFYYSRGEGKYSFKCMAKGKLAEIQKMDDMFPIDHLPF